MINNVINVIFDLDGTLLDTNEGIIESIRYALNCLGYAPLSIEDLYSFIGPPLKRSFIEIARCTSDEADQAVALYREHYSSLTVKR